MFRGRLWWILIERIGSIIVLLFRPPVEAAAQKAENNHADDGAGSVDENIGDHGGAAGDEHLVEFIGGGVEEDDEDGDGGFAPAPRARVAANGFADGAPEQGGEDGILREVTTFADGVMDGFDVCLGHVREEPMQQGFDQPGRMGVGFGIAGTKEDERHPGQGHKPVF